MRKVAAGLALDHVAGQSPGGAGEADQCLARGQFGRDGLQGLVDGGKPRLQIVGRQSRQILRLPDRLQPGALALLEPDLLSQRQRHDQDVGEDDGGVQVEAPQRLQGRLGGQIRPKAEVDEVLGFGPHLTILRQIAPGLPHQPDRQALGRLPFETLQKGLVFGSGRGVIHGSRSPDGNYTSR